MSAGLRRMKYFLLLLPLLFFFWVGYQGIDFGNHWDEQSLIKAVESSVNTGTLLPSMYNYPSVSYLLTLSRIAPDLIIDIRDLLSSDIRYDTPVRKEILTPTTDHMTPKDYLLQVRCIFMTVTLLSVVWTYLLVISWRKSRTEAATAALLLGSSWEIAYHARWIAPDGVLMQFCILTALLIFISMESENRSGLWLRCASCTAGLACGTKYFGGVMLFPVLLTHIYNLRRPGKNNPRRYAEFLVLIFSFCLTFFITTPGAVLQPVYFVYEVLRQIGIYKSGWWDATVAGGVEHFRLDINYLSLVFFSSYWPISLFFSLMLPLGLYTLSKDNFFKTCIFLSGPIVWLFYESSQNVMFVRNLLLIGPFMAIIASAGVATVLRFSRHLVWKGLVIFFVLLFLCFNFSWLVKAAYSIRDRAVTDHVHTTYDYLSKNGNCRFYLSGFVRQSLAGTPLNTLKNIAVTPTEAQEYIFQSREPFKLNLRGNRWGRYKVISGAYDVNFNYYPLWEEPKIVSVSVRDALEMKIID